MQTVAALNKKYGRYFDNNTHLFGLPKVDSVFLKEEAQLNEVGVASFVSAFHSQHPEVHSTIFEYYRDTANDIKSDVSMYLMVGLME